MDGSVPVDQAYPKDVTDLHEAQPTIAALRGGVGQHTELTHRHDVLPQQRQRCAWPEVRG